MHRTALQPQRCRCGSVPHDPLPAAIPSRRADLRRWRAQPSRSASRCQLRAMPDVGAAIDSLVTSGAPAPLREAVQVRSFTSIPLLDGHECHIGMHPASQALVYQHFTWRHAVRRSSRPSSRR